MAVFEQDGTKLWVTRLTDGQTAKQSQDNQQGRCGAGNPAVWDAFYHKTPFTGHCQGRRPAAGKFIRLQKQTCRPPSRFFTRAKFSPGADSKEDSPISHGKKRSLLPPPFRRNHVQLGDHPEPTPKKVKPCKSAVTKNKNAQK
jgi:hypothetical protein